MLLATRVHAALLWQGIWQRFSVEKTRLSPNSTNAIRLTNLETGVSHSFWWSTKDRAYCTTVDACWVECSIRDAVLRCCGITSATPYKDSQK